MTLGRYISLTPSPLTTPMDLVHGLLEWTTHGLPEMDHPEFCGKHEFNDARIWTKDAIDQQSQLRITCDATDLIPNWTLGHRAGF